MRARRIDKRVQNALLFDVWEGYCPSGFAETFRYSFGNVWECLYNRFAVMGVGRRTGRRRHGICAKLVLNGRGMCL